MTAEELIAWKNVGIVLLITGVLFGLHIILHRERVKRDLYEKICEPLSVRWSVFSSTWNSCAFKVTFRDFNGNVHKGMCRVYFVVKGVIWESDQIIETGQ